MRHDRHPLDAWTPRLEKSSGTPTQKVEFAGDNLFFLQAANLPNPVNDRVTGDDASLFLANGNFIPEVAARVLPTSSKIFMSGYSVQALDERLSLDVECVFPASRKISILNGAETHEYLLVRFDLSNFKSFSSTVRQNDEPGTESTQ